MSPSKKSAEGAPNHDAKICVSLGVDACAIRRNVEVAEGVEREAVGPFSNVLVKEEPLPLSSYLMIEFTPKLAT